MTELLFLAHAGEGATWQALLTTITLGLVVVTILTLAGRIRLEEPGDLILPLAAVAIVSSLSPVVSATLSDFVGYAVPVGAMLLIGLVLTATSPLDLTWTAPLTLVVVVLGALGAFAFGNDINVAWHPRDATLPLADDAEIEILAPEEDSTVSAGDVTIQIGLSGATVGPADLPEDQVPDDPEELGRIRLFVDGVELTDAPVETCTVAEPCSQLSYPLGELAAGEHTVIVEYLTADGIPLAPAVFARTTFATE